MAIQDFEWGGDVELTCPSQARLAESAEAGEAGEAGETVDAPLAPTPDGWFARLRKNIWLEPALKLAGMALLLGVLAGIGVVATTYAKPGLQLPQGSRALADALGTSWLKPSPGASADSSTTHASAAPANAMSGAATVSVAEAEQVPSGAPAPGPSEGAPAAPGITADGKVILNTASADELTKLPGVGPKRASAIVALRTKLKRFKHPTDLLRVKGIGPKSLQRMLPHLVLDAPAS